MILAAYRKTHKNSDIRKKYTAMILKFDLYGFFIKKCVRTMQMEWQTV